VFVGISDYGDRTNGLNYTAEDAVRSRDALVRAAGMRTDDALTLLDSDATVEALTQALDDLASRLGPADTLVFFFSGHGSRLERPSGFDAADPDGLDETIELYDAALRDDALKAALARIDAGTMLIVLDSCFSGGFAKEVISAPGRMGMFSSEEDVTSAVAEELEAGGYLANFFEVAVGAGAADENDDRLLTAFELSQYVRERYRSDVTTKGASDYVSAVDNLSSQHVIIDRGSLSPDTVLFHLTGEPMLAEETSAVVRFQMARLTAAAEAAGYTAFGTPFGGALSDGRVDTFTLTLPADGEHFIVAACDADCADLDLQVAELDGAEVAADRALDDRPVIVVPAGHPGAHVLTVSMAACSINPCRYEVAVFRRVTNTTRVAAPAPSPSGLRRSVRF
jgi:hypothetical protein